jgi:mono/diheme cytochrome c family protein
MQVFGPVARRALTLTLFGVWFALVLSSVQTSGRQQAQVRASTPASPRPVFDQYCITCHNQKLHTAGLALDTLDITNPGANAEVWEKVIAKLRQGTMPPPGRPRPDAATYRATASWLETEIDRVWAAHPSPAGSARSIVSTARNTTTRFATCSLDLDVKPLLPGDETADGNFDASPAPCRFLRPTSNATCPSPSGSRDSRWVCRLSVRWWKYSTSRYTFCKTTNQSEDLPLGSRGGIAVRHVFPVGGEYDPVRLQRQYQDYIKGMGWPQQLDIRLDGKLLKRFTVGGTAPGRPAASSYAGDGEPNFAGAPEWEEYMLVTGDKGLEVRLQVEAGPHVVGASFVREMWEPEGLPQPQQRARVITNDQVYMDFANVHSVQIGGPYQTTGPAKDTPSRRAIFVCQPKVAAEERAWRRHPVSGARPRTGP